MGFKQQNYDTLYSIKADIQIELKALMRGHREQRELELIPEQTRAVCKHELHEFILSDEPDILSRGTVNRIAYIGFGEIISGGLMATGDRVTIGEDELGTVVGFDYTHMPNHMNIVLFSPNLQSGEEKGLKPGQVMTVNR